MRCAAAHADDPTPCDGGRRDVVRVVDAAGSGATGCEHHGARMLASLRGGRVYPGPGSRDGQAAIRVYNAAQRLHPFPWVRKGGEER